MTPVQSDSVHDPHLKDVERCQGSKSKMHLPAFAVIAWCYSTVLNRWVARLGSVEQNRYERIYLTSVANVNWTSLGVTQWSYVS